MTTFLIDTNILLRFFLQDDSVLFKKAHQIFASAESGNSLLIIDELVIAETVWVMSSFYTLPPTQISDKLIKLMTQPWIISGQKNLILLSLELFSETNLAYIDCWLTIKSKISKTPLITFDKKLKKLSEL